MSEMESVELIRETMRRFAAAKITPHYETWEKEGIIPRALWLELGEAGLLCADIPEAYGGAGFTFRASMAIQEELARMGFAALASNVAVHSDIVAHYLHNHGTEAQKQRYLPRMVSGECVGAIAMTEPGAGSDLQGIATVAKHDANGFVVDGSKTFITNGQHCDLVVVAAKTDPSAKASRGTSLLLVDADAAGFTRGRNLDKIGQHCADTSELFFEGVRIGADAVLGEVNRGFYALMNELPRERVALAMSAVGATRGALDLAIAYVKERRAFGKTIGDFQNTRFRLAEMETQYRLAKAFIEQCIDLFEAGQLDTATASMAKLATTEIQCQVADGCLQLFGGYGYMTEYPISRAFVDARVQRIYGGTSEIMKELIARSVLDA